MSEKNGNTIKLVYDFNEAYCCEVEYEPGKWARATPREFRSFQGNRRILNVDDSNNIFYEEYNGPVYLFGTNKIIENVGKGIQFENDIDPRDQYRKPGKWRT